jgi:hypothetical protein
VVVDHPTIQWAPQAGIMYMGVADPLTISPVIIETMADGVHHNVCEEGVTEKRKELILEIGLLETKSNRGSYSNEFRR